MVNPKKLVKFRLLLLPTLIFLVIFLTAMLFLRPKVGEIYQIKKNFSKEKETLAQLTQKAANLESFDEGELSAKAEFTFKALPTEKDISSALLSLKALSSQVGVNLKGIQVEPGELSTASAQPKESQGGELPFLTFELKVEGEIEKIKSFLEKIEASLPLMRIKEMALIQKEGNLKEVNLSLTAYFLPLPKTLGSIESPSSPITSQEDAAFRTLSEFKPILTEEFLEEIQSGGKENPFASF